MCFMWNHRVNKLNWRKLRPFYHVCRVLFPKKLSTQEKSMELKSIVHWSNKIKKNDKKRTFQIQTFSIAVRSEGRAKLPLWYPEKCHSFVWAKSSNEAKWFASRVVNKIKFLSHLFPMHTHQTRRCSRTLRTVARILLNLRKWRLLQFTIIQMNWNTTISILNVHHKNAVYLLNFMLDSMLS